MLPLHSYVVLFLLVAFKVTSTPVAGTFLPDDRGIADRLVHLPDMSLKIHALEIALIHSYAINRTSPGYSSPFQDSWDSTSFIVYVVGLEVQSSVARVHNS